MVNLKKFILLGLILYSTQNLYSQNYFASPIKEKIVLSGTFGELRKNHFHSGLDIKTNGKVGMNVYASADGYISRIKISHYGYGKALYITHPNGYTTVYAHLYKFSPEIEKYIKSKQYKKETYEIQLFPTKNSLKVKKNEFIAFSGNTGGSSGPHLHFEIRDRNERPINPMLFGIDVDDEIKPKIYDIFAYPISKKSHVNGSTKRIKLKLTKKSDGEYITSTVFANGKIGFGIIANDKLDYANNKNGLSQINTFFNNQKKFEARFDRFSFAESKHINKYIDYEYYNLKGKRIQKLFINNKSYLSLLKTDIENGQLNILNSSESSYLIEIKDFKGNMTHVEIPIKYKPMKTIDDIKNDYKHTFINSKKDTVLGNKKNYINITNNTFYEDVKINFKIKNDTLKIHEPTIPLQKPIEINFNIEEYNENEKKFIFIARIDNLGKIKYCSTEKNGNSLKTKTKNLGTYTLSKDKKGPKIKAINFSDLDWISNEKYLKIKIEDDISGIKDYKATVNGNWILMEYDPKSNTLTHDFSDGVINKVENRLSVIVTDNMGNSSKFESCFYRSLKN